MLNRVELLTTATNSIKNEMNNVMERVDEFNAATTRDIKILQTKLDVHRME